VGTLGRIVAEAEIRAAALEARADDLATEAEENLPGPSLERALRSTIVTVLAEVKRRSPSKGVIAGGLDAAGQAQAYLDGGAAGVSVLTEPAHFGGSNEDLLAALLIVRALSPERLTLMMQTGRTLGLELLVEVRDAEELHRALSAGATIIGVNNRNLETLEIDEATAERVIPRIPGNLLAIAESGVRTRADVERYAACGADAVLVGSSLSSAADPISATRSLVGVDRRPRD
jgi:indole-3-glycerol phosphate synthase